MSSILILNAQVVNEGKIQVADILVKDGFIDQIGTNLSGISADKTIDATGKYLLPEIGRASCRERV